MITNVSLTNWKRHAHFEHSFVPGLNFILGPNGRGKSSLIQGMRFALFGPSDLAEAREAIRFDATSASAEVLLDGERGFGIARTIDSRGRLSERVTSAEPMSSQALLAQAFGADPAFLRALLFLGEGDIYAADAANSGIDQQLEELFSVSGLQKLVTEMHAKRTALAKTQRAQRSELKFSREEVALLVEEAARLTIALEDLGRHEERSRDVLLRIDSLARERERQIARAQIVEVWRQRASKFVEELNLNAADVQFEAALIELESRRETLEARLRELTALRGEARGRASTIESFIQTLDDFAEAHQCPVCHQELDDAHRNTVLTEHSADLQDLGRELQRRGDEIDRVTSELDAARTAAASGRALLAERPDSLDSTVAPPDDVHEQLDAARTKLDEDRASRIVTEQRLLEVREQLAMAEASRRLEEQVTTAFRQEALLEASESGLRDFIAHLRRSVMEPIADQLTSQWKAYRPDAEWSLALDDRGALCLARQGTTRSFRALSSGEKTVSSVLLRVALMCGLTSSDVIVLDEPLEHLDPRSRRLLISSLHHAIRTGLLRQIIISTYEESLVRRLVTRDDVSAIWLE